MYCGPCLLCILAVGLIFCAGCGSCLLRRPAVGLIFCVGWLCALCNIRQVKITALCLLDRWKKKYKVFWPNNFKKEEAQLKTHDKTQENKETLVVGNIFMKARPKKGLACLLPNDWLSIYKSQVRSLSYQKRNRIGGKKERENRSVRPPPIPNPLFQISRVGHGGSLS